MNKISYKFVFKKNNDITINVHVNKDYHRRNENRICITESNKDAHGQ